MTTEKLKQAVKLSEKIETLESINNNAKNQKCEWIVFSFGNGSSAESVCTDPETIDKARELIVKENELKLAKLKDEFSKL